MFRQVVPLKEPVLSYVMTAECLFYLFESTLAKWDRQTQTVTAEVDLLGKPGLARHLTLDDDHLYCRDFCDLYLLDREDLSCRYHCRPGQDSESDICGVIPDVDRIYVCLRNGPLVVLRKDDLNR